MPKGIPSDPVKRTTSEWRYNWKGDAALTQTKRARATRLYPLTDCEDCGVPATDRHHKDGNTGNNARGNIAMLCRRCHMLADGRMERFRETARLNAIRNVKPPRACTNCGFLTNRTWKGICHRCNDYKRRTGFDRPSTTDRLAGGPPINSVTPCPVCGRETRLKTKGRCLVCYNYWRLNGKDRETFTFRTATLAQENRNERRRRRGK
ncbi:MAG: hypothetical protein QOE26_2777 [Verrucomicrobiota bacterium]|jgi:hypothetical protein